MNEFIAQRLPNVDVARDLIESDLSSAFSGKSAMCFIIRSNVTGDSQQATFR